MAPVWLLTSPQDSERELRAWWEVLPVDSYWVNYLFRPMASLSRPSPHPQVELEDGIDMLIERLAVPNFWLQPVISTDYIKDLPFWQFRGWHVDVTSASIGGHVSCSHIASPKVLESMMDGKEPGEYILCHCICSQDQTRFRSSSGVKNFSISSNTDASPHEACSCMEISSASSSTNNKDVSIIAENLPSCPCVDNCGNCKGLTYDKNDLLPCCPQKKRCLWRDDTNNSISENEQEENDIDIGWKPPEGVLSTTDCAVCLEGYRFGTILCALPCGHNYHQHCILAWLQRDNHHCPVCRWPAYRSKNRQSHFHQE